MDALGHIRDLKFPELIRLCVNVDKHAKEYHDIDDMEDKSVEDQDLLLSQFADSKVVFLNQYFPENTAEDMDKIISLCEREDQEDFDQFIKDNYEKKINLIGMALDATAEDDFELARNILIQNKLSDPIPHMKSWQTVYGKTLKPLVGYEPSKELTDTAYHGVKQRMLFKCKDSVIFKNLKIHVVENILFDVLPEEYKEHTLTFFYLLFDYCLSMSTDIEDFITFLSISLRRVHLLRHRDLIMSPSNETFLSSVIQVLDVYLDNK